MSDVNIQVYGDHFTAGVLARNGVIIITAPILQYMLGWDGKKFHAYCKQKGWPFAIVPMPAKFEEQG